jgi:hypothetical protein
MIVRNRLTCRRANALDAQIVGCSLEDRIAACTLGSAAQITCEKSGDRSRPTAYPGGKLGRPHLKASRMSDPYAMWTLNETLLQSYRSIFVSSESFLLAVGAIVAGESFEVVVAVAALALLLTWAIWFPVVTSRHRIVDYYKCTRDWDDEQRAAICEVELYVRCRKLRREANDLFKIRSNWRETRIKLDFITPVLFSAIWVILVAHASSHFQLP